MTASKNVTRATILVMAATALGVGIEACGSSAPAKPAMGANEVSSTPGHANGEQGCSGESHCSAKGAPSSSASGTSM